VSSLFNSVIVFLHEVLNKNKNMRDKLISFLLVSTFFFSECHKAPVEDRCGDKRLTTIEKFHVFIHSNGTIMYRAKFAIDVDGSPRAYGPNDTGLDINAHAKTDGKWVGIVTDNAGNLVVQKQGDPYPGFYVSQTSLYSDLYPNTDPRAYVDAEKIPYIVLPNELMTLSKAEIGDMAYAFNPATKKGSYAIVADEGPSGLLGEGSVFLAKTIGIPNISPRDGGLEGEAIQYIVFPKSGIGNGKHRTIVDIDKVGKAKMQLIGNETEILQCF
jgi:Fungal chitosanase of glycosyl hydrolase group 75